jgi:hypothetical protein
MSKKIIEARVQTTITGDIATFKKGLFFLCHPFLSLTKSWQTTLVLLPLPLLGRLVITVPMTLQSLALASAQLLERGTRQPLIGGEAMDSTKRNSFKAIYK